MSYHARKLQSQVICVIALTVCLVLASCGTRGSIDNRNFAHETATAQTRTTARTPEPTDTPALPLTGTPRSGPSTQTPTLLPTTVSSAAPDDETIAALITLTCFSHGVADVQVTVGRAEGGQKGAIVTLKTDTDDLEEVASVVHDVLFNMFFLSLLIMLSFSNAIICFSSLYRSEEMEHLLSSPVSVSAVLSYKFFESLAFSSWAFVLLAVPFLLAYGISSGARPLFYPVIFLFFIPFIVIFAVLRGFYSTGGVDDIVAVLPFNIQKVLPFMVGLAGRPVAAGFGLSFYAFYFLVGLGLSSILQRIMGTQVMTT